MGDIADLLPRDKTITVKGVELTVKPLRLSHTLNLSKIGDILQHPDKYDAADIKAAEDTLDIVVSEVVPELSGQKLGMDIMLELIGELMKTVNPSDNQELDEKGVQLGGDPKAGGNG